MQVREGFTGKKVHLESSPGTQQSPMKMLQNWRNCLLRFYPTLPQGSSGRHTNHAHALLHFILTTTLSGHRNSPVVRDPVSLTHLTGLFCEENQRRGKQYKQLWSPSEARQDRNELKEIKTSGVTCLASSQERLV